MTTLADVADQLKDARRRAGLTQQELADRAGLNRLTVGRMENLTHGDMSVSALVRLLENAILRAYKREARCVPEVRRNRSRPRIEATIMCASGPM